MALTMNGAITGTPAFMAPEAILADKEIGPGADIYSLGCVGYWLLTGMAVFEEENAMAMAVAHVRTPVPPSRKTEQAIPPALEEVVLSCLEKDPDKRPQSADELRRLLYQCPPGEASWEESQAEEWWTLHMAKVLRATGTRR